MRENNHKNIPPQTFLSLLHFLSDHFGIHTLIFNLVSPYAIYKLKQSHIILNLAKIRYSKNNFLYCIVQCKVDHLMHSSCSRVNIQISFKKRLIQKEQITATPITLIDILTIILTIFISHSICCRFILLNNFRRKIQIELMYAFYLTYPIRF